MLLVPFLGGCLQVVCGLYRLKQVWSLEWFWVCFERWPAQSGNRKMQLISQSSIVGEFACVEIYLMDEDKEKGFSQRAKKGNAQLWNCAFFVFKLSPETPRFYSIKWPIFKAPI